MSLIGQKFGEWTVIGDAEPVRVGVKDAYMAQQVLAECSCGVQRVMRAQTLKDPKRCNMCGKCALEIAKQKRIEQHIGKKFFDWTIIGEGRKGSQGGRQFLCKCKCGREKSITLYNLKTGDTKQCKSCCRTQQNTTHGATTGDRTTPEYRAWAAMKRRCLNPNVWAYEHYGGRGIKVCERWLTSFESFFEDMGTKPSLKHSLDRIDVNGNYCPENCKWSSQTEQVRNTRRNLILTYQGSTMCVSEWAEKLGFKPATLAARIRNGWNTEKALTTPLR